jgi:hypothetical protein
MALTATTTFDLVGQTQVITFYEGASQVDQISFGSNSITFATSSTFNLSKSDYLLYAQYLNAFNNLLYVNFPSVISTVGGKWPLSVFEISETNSGALHVNYLQTSQGVQVLGVNYVPLAGQAAFATRASPVTISMQEWFMTVNMIAQYTNQVAQN